MLTGRHIILGLSGGAACFKAAQLCRLLVHAGARVQVVMSDAACKFITPVTMQALSGQAVYVSQWDQRPDNAMAHINLSRDADAIIVAPASADFMAQLVQGRAAELLPLLCLARPRGKLPLLVAPSMNREMWSHPATQRNLRQLAEDGARVLGVDYGEQACGETGDGRMLEPPALLAELVAALSVPSLHGKRVVITAGPTHEAIDPVRVLSNLSSGKMGFALAQAAWEAGATVTVVAGPVALETPHGVQRVDVVSARDMQQAARAAVEDADIFIASAAVADWRPAEVASQKLKKQDGAMPTLEFVENPDILAEIARLPRAQSGALYCVGFAAETEKLREHAQAKRQRKGVPMLVANDGPQTFGRDDNAALLLTDHDEKALARSSKLDMARRIVTEIAAQLRDPA